MVPYNTKMWTVPPEQMAADWTGGFIPPVDLRRSLDGALLKRDSSVGLNAEFFYPEAGISTLAETLASGLHGSIRYDTVATTHRGPREAGPPQRRKHRLIRFSDIDDPAPTTGRHHQRPVALGEGDCRNPSGIGSGARRCRRSPTSR